MSNVTPQIGDRILFIEIGGKLVLIPQGRQPEVGDTVPFFKLPDDTLVTPGVSTPEVGDGAIFYTSNFQNDDGTKELISITGGRGENGGHENWICTQIWYADYADYYSNSNDWYRVLDGNWIRNNQFCEPPVGLVTTEGKVRVTLSWLYGDYKITITDGNGSYYKTCSGTDQTLGYYEYDETYPEIPSYATTKILDFEGITSPFRLTEEIRPFRAPDGPFWYMAWEPKVQIFNCVEKV